MAGFFVSLSRLRVVFFFACESNRVSLKVIFVPRKKKKKREKNFKKVQRRRRRIFFLILRQILAGKKKGRGKKSHTKKQLFCISII